MTVSLSKISAREAHDQIAARRWCGRWRRRSGRGPRGCCGRRPTRPAATRSRSTRRDLAGNTASASGTLDAEAVGARPAGGRACGAYHWPPYRSSAHALRRPPRSQSSPPGCARSATCRASRRRSSPTWRSSSASRCSWRARPASARPSSRRRSPRYLQRELVRLQCYEGLDEAKSLYEWNYRKQLLRIQAEQAGAGWDAVQEDIFGEEFLLARPLMTRDHLRAAGRAADRRDRQDRPGVRGDAAGGPVRLPDLDPRARPPGAPARIPSCC